MFGISSMANGVVTPRCGSNPSPRMYPQTRNEETSTPFWQFLSKKKKTPFRQLQFGQSKSLGFCFRLSDGSREKGWAPRVSAPLSDATFHEDGDGVDPSAGSPPLHLGDVRAAIPKHCWVKSPWKSMSYVVRDVAVVSGLVSLAVKFDCWPVWLFYWCAQSTMFLDLFVIGHDCGHGSFSDNSMLNSIIGHVLHSLVLVPFHAWRVCHLTHHQKIQNHGYVENDDLWRPLNEKSFKSLDKVTQILRFFLLFPMLVFPFYLCGSPVKMGSHYDPNSKLFLTSERKDCIASTACCIAMVALLVALSFVIGSIQMLKLYGVPYLGFVIRDYGSHGIGTHVIHLLYPQIPHYNLIEATETAKPVLGKYYSEKKSVPLPLLSL